MTITDGEAKEILRKARLEGELERKQEQKRMHDLGYEPVTYTETEVYKLKKRRA